MCQKTTVEISTRPTSAQVWPSGPKLDQIFTLLTATGPTRLAMLLIAIITSTLCYQLCSTGMETDIGFLPISDLAGKMCQKCVPNYLLTRTRVPVTEVI